MGDRDPPQDLRQLPVSPWPEEQMPVRGHKAIGHWRREQGQLAHPSVQHMVGMAVPGDGGWRGVADC